MEKQPERIPVPKSELVTTLVVDTFPNLGRVTALRFLEWVSENEDGVVALPTGKTPQYFISWIEYMLENWGSKQVQGLLAEYGLGGLGKPSFSRLRFVQIDEFYPINVRQHNSFHYYVKKYYMDTLGLDEKRALLINPNRIGLSDEDMLDSIWPDHTVDISLRLRGARSKLEEAQQQLLVRVDQFCSDYETQIREMGGIGFFLGGIGPDGHIGFNVRGSDHYSTTRLTQTNYETQAAAATDLGGIEVTRQRLVITIGLATITYNPECTAIIMVAGEAKAPIACAGITSEQSNQVPSSALQKLRHARFYITGMAANALAERRYLHHKANSKRLLDDTARIITELALQAGKKITDLQAGDFALNPSAKLLGRELGDKLPHALKELDAVYRKNIASALDIPSGETFLHTAPHHDDIMLGYIPYLARLIRDPSNTHYFNYLTSGFTAVTNANLVEHLDIAQELLNEDGNIDTLVREKYFDHTNSTFRNRDVLEHLDGVAAHDYVLANFGTARRFLRNLNELYGDSNLQQFRKRIDEIHKYLGESYPGMKDRQDIQRLKGMLREWEADLLWGFFGFNSESVIHSRLGFYQGDIFTEDPQFERDVAPILKTLHALKPTVITVTLDPEGSGPDTHYKVLQAVTEALKVYQSESGRDDIEIWGYRNVWHRYQPYETNLFVPVTLMSMHVMHQTFTKSFLSQATASFPSHEYDGPFSVLTRRLQAEQYNSMLKLLGRDYFYRSSDSRIRSTRGLIFLNKMSLGEFYEHSRALRKLTTAQSES